MVIMLQQIKSIGNNIKLFFLIFLFTLIFSNFLYAKDNSEITPSIGVEVGYSDNVNQNNTNEVDSFITRISPAIKYTNQGGRVKTNVDYRLNGYAYSSSDVNDEQNLQHHLQANMQSELIQKHFFVDLDASITQELINKRNNNLSNNSGIDNLTESYTYGINPYLKNRWDGYADSLVSYEYNEVLFNDSSNNGSELFSSLSNDSSENKFQILIDNGKRFKNILWKLDFKYSKIDYKDTLISSKDSESESLLGELGYRFNNEFTVTSKFGYEDYEQTTDGPNTDNSGSFYGLGLTWTPSSRTLLDISVGDRFYGDAYDLVFEHKGDVFGFNFSYNESITSSRDEYRDNNTNTSSTTDSVLSSSLNQTLDSLYLSKSYNADINYQLKKLGIRFGAYHDDRSYGQGIISILDEKVYGAKVSISYKSKRSTYNFNTHVEDRTSSQLSQEGVDTGIDVSWDLKVGKRMNSITSVSWLNQEYESNNSSDEWQINWQLNRRLAKNLSGNIRLSHQERTSDINLQEYDENSISVGIHKTFR